jgi:hypothetical protein
MQLIKRSLVLIKAKQPFINWVNRKPFSIPLTPADVNQDCLTILVPDFNTSAELMAYIAPFKEIWFEIELATWNQDEQSWPNPRTSALFDEWFDLEIHSMVWDSAEVPPRRNEIRLAEMRHN